MVAVQIAAISTVSVRKKKVAVIVLDDEAAMTHEGLRCR